MEIKNVIDFLNEKSKSADADDKKVFSQIIAKLRSSDQKITELEQDLKTEKEARLKDKSDFETQRKEEWINFYKSEIFKSAETIYDQLDPDVKHVTLSKLVDKALNEKNLQLTFNEKGEMQLLNKDSAKYYGSNNTVVTPEAFIQNVLTQNKILKPAENKPGDDIVIKPKDTTRTFIPGTNNNNQTVAALNKQNREAFQSEK